MGKVETSTFYFSILIVDFVLKERYRKFEKTLWITPAHYYFFKKKEVGAPTEASEPQKFLFINITKHYPTLIKFSSDVLLYAK